MSITVSAQFASTALAIAFLQAAEKAGASSTSTAGTADAGKGTSTASTTVEDKTVAPKHTLAEVQALLGKIGATYGDDKAASAAAQRALFVPLGYTKSKEIGEKHMDQVFAAAEAALADREKAKAAEDI